MAIIYSYPTLVPQLGDKVLGSNIVDSAGQPVLGNPTVQYTFNNIKTLVDQKFVQQLTSSNTSTSQGPGGTNSLYNIVFGSASGAPTDNVQLAADGKLTFNIVGTYYISLKYYVSMSATGNSPFLLFRTYQDNTTQVGETTVLKSSINKFINEPLFIDKMVNITSPGTYYYFQMLRDSVGSDDGSLYKIDNSQSGWANTPNASLTVSKLV